MTNWLAFRKSYEGTLKFRCVDRATIFVEVIKNDVKQRYFEKAGISARSFDKYWKSKLRPSSLSVSDEQAIKDNFRYLFYRAVPPYRPGRFNRSNFAALYTAKDQATARAERAHYVAGATRDFDYVIYSIYVSAEIADLRPLIDAGQFVIEKDTHLNCQNVADQVRNQVSGVAWYSARREDGHCCAFFRCDEIYPGRIEEEGTIVP